MRLLTICGAAALAGSFAACSYSASDGVSATPPEADFALADTNWQLTKISTSPSQETQVEPGLYSLLIRSDGTTAMRLDCNRGFGRWEGANSNGLDSGSIRLIDEGITRALCPPESIGDQVLVDLRRINMFKVSGSKLTLSDETGELTYHWEEMSEVPNPSEN